jgi:DNA polymerase III alpha subunit (gram-positive type)
MDYNVDWMNHKLTGSVHLAPAAYNYKYVNRESLASRYGIDAGKHHLNDFGSQITVDLLWKFSDNISWKTRLYGYTTYQRAELEWENTLTFKFNRWISSNIFVYPRFDDGATRINDHSYWQLKEYASVGFSYSF